MYLQQQQNYLSKVRNKTMLWKEKKKYLKNTRKARKKEVSIRYSFNNPYLKRNKYTNNINIFQLHATHKNRATCFRTTSGSTYVPRTPIHRNKCRTSTFSIHTNCTFVFDSKNIDFLSVFIGNYYVFVDFFCFVIHFIFYLFHSESDFFFLL